MQKLNNETTPPRLKSSLVDYLAKLYFEKGIERLLPEKLKEV